MAENLVDYKEIGLRIRRIRIERKLTQAQLSEKASIEPSYMSHIERGVAKASLPTFINIANALNVTLDELVYGSLVKNKHISVDVIDEMLIDCTQDELKQITEIIRFSKKLMRSRDK